MCWIVMGICVSQHICKDLYPIVRENSSPAVHGSTLEQIHLPTVKSTLSTFIFPVLKNASPPVQDLQAPICLIDGTLQNLILFQSLVQLGTA